MENKEISVLDMITAMIRMNNDRNYDNLILGKKIVESLNWFLEHNDILKFYYERQIGKDFS